MDFVNFLIESMSRLELSDIEGKKELAARGETDQGK